MTSDLDKNQNQGKDVEGAAKKIPYPKSVFFIIVCEFCERFCYYGMRTVLTLYFVQVMSWSDDTATVIYHVYIMVSYFTPLIGAMLADSYLGKFKTIFYLGVVYCIGCLVLSAAATPPLKIPTMAFSMVGLGLIALGTGGIKPCVSAFGADQFKLPEQEIQVASFFAIFYFAINSGSLLTTIITPILREDVKCFGDDHCYSVAFSIPAVLMIIALVIFVVGRPLYKVNKPEGNIVAEVVGAIWHALTRRGKEVKAGRKRDHWLDYADDKYGKRFLEEAKVLMKVLFLYIPVPLFWALFDQQGSRWTLQATRMDGNTWGWVIKPDQMQVVNPVLVLALIPVFDRGIYPLLAKFGIFKNPLQRLVVGGVFAGIAFVVSGLVELSLEKTYATVLTKQDSNIHVINGFHQCPMLISIDGEKTYQQILPNEMFIYEAIQAKTYPVNLKIENVDENNACTGFRLQDQKLSIEAVGEEARTFIAYPNDKEIRFLKVEEEDDLEKAESGNPRVRTVYTGFENLKAMNLQGDSEKNIFDFDLKSGVHFTEFAEVEPTEYELSLSHSDTPEGLKLNKTLDMKLGAVYILSIVRDPNPSGSSDKSENYLIGLHEITKSNSVHMLMLLPQYIIMSMGEIMFSITIMDFSYVEGPPSMKAVMQSAWLMTVAFGNLLDVIIAALKLFDQQWKEFFLFAGIMFAGMILFSYMCYTYVPTDRAWLRDDEDKDGDKKDKEMEGIDNPALEHKEHKDE